MLVHFLPTTDGYMGLLCEAMPTNYALMCEAHTVQMHTPSKIINGICLLYCTGIPVPDSSGAITACRARVANSERS